MYMIKDNKHLMMPFAWGEEKRLYDNEHLDDQPKGPIANVNLILKLWQNIKRPNQNSSRLC